jgi:hypothetical protein
MFARHAGIVVSGLRSPDFAPGEGSEQVREGELLPLLRVRACLDDCEGQPRRRHPRNALAEAAYKESSPLRFTRMFVVGAAIVAVLLWLGSSSVPGWVVAAFVVVIVPLGIVAGVKQKRMERHLARRFWKALTRR